MKYYYEVWGTDTFAGEDYLCGTFTSPEEANLLCRNQQYKVAKTQDEGLRDTFWVSKVTEEEIKEREQRKEQIAQQRMSESSFDLSRLELRVKELLSQFNEAVKNFEFDEGLKQRTPKLYLLTQHELTYNDGGDCYNMLRIELKYYRSATPFGIQGTISFNKGAEYGGGNGTKFFGTYRTINDVIEWLNDDSTAQNVYDFYRNLIVSFYDK